MFSIIMPTYNYGSAIGQAIASVVAQTYGDWELLIVTDGCTDDTLAVIEGFHDRRLRPVVSGHSGRPGLLRNRGSAVAEGEIICYLDHDDRWAPRHLASLDAAYQDPGTRIVATGCYRVAPDGAKLGATIPLNLMWHPELQVVSPIFEPSRVSHRRQAVEAVGGWATDDIGLEDWDLWVRLADAGETFTLISDRSVYCTLRPTSRRHSLGHRYVMTLGPPVDASTADEVMAQIKRPEIRCELSRRHQSDQAEWYRDLWDSGELRMADSMTIEDMIGALRGDSGDHDFHPHLRPCGDGFVFCRVLACRSRGHAERIVAINRRRTGRSAAYLEDLFARAMGAS